MVYIIYIVDINDMMCASLSRQKGHHLGDEDHLRRGVLAERQPTDPQRRGAPGVRRGRRCRCGGGRGCGSVGGAMEAGEHHGFSG